MNRGWQITLSDGLYYPGPLDDFRYPVIKSLPIYVLHFILSVDFCGVDLDAAIHCSGSRLNGGDEQVNETRRFGWRRPPTWIASLLKATSRPVT